MKINKKILLNQLVEMGYNPEEAKEELNSLIDWFLSLPKKMTLYRVIQVDELSDINKERPGSHYSRYKSELISNHCYAVGYGDKKFLMTIRADKSLFDINQTLSNNILYPNENEITLKNKGFGAEIISIEEICNELNEDRIKKILREETSISNFISRRYKPKEFESLLKRSYDYYWIMTKNKEDFIDGVINGTIIVYFRILYDIEISNVLPPQEIEKFSNYVRDVYVGLIELWYNKKRKETKNG